MEKERKENQETGKKEKVKYKKPTLTKHKKLRDITCGVTLNLSLK
jgi:hypothetical protein